MTLEDLGAIGEFLGFFAVLATLLYLAVQTKNAQRATRAQVTRNFVNDFQIIWSALEDPEKARVVRVAVNDWHALNRNEKTIAHAFFVALVGHLTNAVDVEEQLPNMSEFIRGWENNVVSLLLTEGGKCWWQEAGYLFRGATYNRIEARLADASTHPPAWTETMSWWQLDEDERAP